ncbi:MAG: TonB-dependent receptor, partial [Acidobacteria bacterium]|nr:TonB-dependent receptor [Acidobacteriota bacterium]
QTTGTLHGLVTDQSSAAITTATVTALHVGTGLTRTTTANTEGTFVLLSLPSGRYRITVTAPGFKASVQNDIELPVGQNIRVDARLDVGAVSERVEVAASATRVDTQASTLGATVDNMRLNSLPLNGRNVLALATILPGVGRTSFPTTQTFSRTGPSVNVSGGRENDNNIMLDGTTMTTSLLKTAQNLPSPDALGEFRVLTNTYSAEYGRAAGGVFLAVSKSGTNNFHGALWEFLRNDALNGRNAFSLTKPFLRQNQYGGSFGGPVLLPGWNGRNRLFFFTSYQGLTIRQQGLNVSFPLSEAERRGDFRLAARPIVDPLNQQPFAGGVIPSSRLDPVAQKVMELYTPGPNQPDGRNIQLRSIPTSSNQLTVKLDFKATSAESLSFRYYRNRDTQEGLAAGNVIPLDGVSSNFVQSWSLGSTHIFGPTLLNDFRASYTRIESLKGPASVNLNRTPRELGARFDQAGDTKQTPSINVSGRFNLSVPFPHFEPDDEIQVDEKLSWIRGRHTAKFGASMMRGRVLTVADWQTSGVVTLDGTFTRDAAADFVLGRPISFTQRNPYHTDLHNYYYHFFAQDDFKLHRRLTVNLGLRYELNLPHVERYNRLAVVRNGLQSTQIPSSPPGLVHVWDPGLPRGLRQPDKNNFGPRIGLAWDVSGDGRTAVRAGYGIFYTSEGAILAQRQTENPPWQRALAFVPPSLSDPYAGSQSPFPYQVDRKSPVFAFPFQALTFPDNFRDGYLQQFNLNVQRQVRSDIFVQVGYVGGVGHKLATMRETNAARFAPGATAANAQQRRPLLPQFYAGISSNNSEGNSNYHSLQFQFEKRFTRSYTLQVAYTFGKSIDERSRGSEGGGTVQDPDNYRKGERGLSDFDQRHLLRINGVWNLPELPGQNRVVRGVMGGWRLSGVVAYSSGLPFTVLSGRDVALAGPSRSLGAQRPDVAGEGVLDTGRSRAQLIDRYFNTAAFAVPQPGRFGNAGRNLLVGPGDVNTNGAIMKRFKLPEERWGAFEFRGEAF